MLGLFAGAGVAVLREMTANVFTTANEVEQCVGLRCLGILPLVALNRRCPAKSISSAELDRHVPLMDTSNSRSSKVNIDEFVIDAPYSRFAETLRNVKVMIHSHHHSNNAKVVGVVSSLSGEGKSVVVANLGALLSGMGARTLLIDCDFHQRSLTSRLAPDTRAGLMEALDDPGQLATLVHQRQRSRLDVLPCALMKRISNGSQLLASSQMEKLLEAARDSYDYVIVDLAPIVPVVDAKSVAHLIDNFVFVIEWGRTKQSVVLEALSSSGVVRERTVGLVLNKADPVALRSIEAYKGDSFRNYYVE